MCISVCVSFWVCIVCVCIVCICICVCMNHMCVQVSYVCVSVCMYHMSVFSVCMSMPVFVCLCAFLCLFLAKVIALLLLNITEGIMGRNGVP